MTIALPSVCSAGELAGPLVGLRARARIGAGREYITRTPWASGVLLGPVDLSF